MKLVIQFLIIALFAKTTVSCAQRITSFNINPVDANMVPNKKGIEVKKGERTLRISIGLSGKTKKDIFYKLSIAPNNINSHPILIDSVIRIKKNDFKAKKIDIELKLKLKELDCLLTNDEFNIKYKSSQNQDSGLSNIQVTIQQIMIPNQSACLLVDESTIVKPYLKTDNIDNGQRLLLLNLKLMGRRDNVQSDAIIISCKQVLPNKKSASEPKFINDFAIAIHKDSFNIDGCPKMIRVPVIVQLTAIEKLKEEEKIDIIILKNNVPDYEHSHTLIIKSPEVKELVKPSEPVELKKKKEYSFSHSCISGKNFIITLLPDSSTGGKIEVKDERDTIAYAYNYYQFFHTADFAKWLLNIFTTRINRFPCNDCVTCTSYMAERTYEELNMLKKAINALAQIAKIETDKSKVEEKTEDKPKSGTDSTKTEKAVSDTFVYYMSYADSSIFSLYVTKEKDLTKLELCKDPKKGDGDCTKERLLEADEKTFNDRVVAMMKKLIGEEAIEIHKMKPANIYGKYKKEENAKQVKEKSAEMKLIENRLTALENEKVTYTDVGTVSLRDTAGKIKIHRPDGTVFESEIDSVTLVIKDGQLMRKQLLVKTKHDYFWNHEAPISVNRINERGGDILFEKNIPNKDNYLLLGEVLEYIGDGYVPDDTTIILTPSKKAQKLSATSNLNSLINFALYTDLTGLLGRRANGIINMDLSGKFITNTRNWPLNVDITPLSFIEANFVLSKFDSKFKSIDSSFLKLGTGGAKDTIDRMQMMQTAWFKGSVKINLLKWQFFYYQKLCLNVGSRINAVNADSLFKKERDILFFDYYAEAEYSISKLRNFGMDLGLRQIFQRISDREPFENKGWECIFNPQISFSYYPIENRNNRIYLRFNYFANRNKEANNFYQLQFGIKSDLKFGSKK